MGLLRLKDGAALNRLTPAGAAIVGALWRTAINLPYDLTVTSGTDGVHTGSNPDPHPFGNALDVRSHDLDSRHKESILALIMDDLAGVTAAMGYSGAVSSKDGGFVTELFFGFLEHPGEPTEHFHFQLRNGRLFATAALSPASSN